MIICSNVIDLVLLINSAITSQYLKRFKLLHEILIKIVLTADNKLFFDYLAQIL